MTLCHQILVTFFQQNGELINLYAIINGDDIARFLISKALKGKIHTDRYTSNKLSFITSNDTCFGQGQEEEKKKKAQNPKTNCKRWRCLECFGKTRSIKWTNFLSLDLYASLSPSIVRKVNEKPLLKD